MLSCICVCVRDLGDSAGAGHEPGFVGGVSALVEVMSGEGVEREQRGEAVLWWLVGSCCVRGFCPGVPARWGGPWARLGAWALSFEIQIKIFILTFSAGRHAEPATAWIGSASRLLARQTARPACCLAVLAMASFSHIAPPEAVATELRPFTPDGERFSLHLLPAGLALPDEEKAHLRGWKHLCDELLPALRSRG